MQCECTERIPREETLKLIKDKRLGLTDHGGGRTEC